MDLKVESDLLIWLPLGLLWVAGATLGLAQWADGSITMNLLVAGQASLHRWGLLSEGGRLTGILLPGHLELLCCCCSGSKGFWDGGLMWLLLPLCFLLLKVTVQSKERKTHG